MCHFLWWRCDEEFIQSQLHRTCCTSLQVQQFHTLFHHLQTHSKLILTACIALLFKKPWLEWGFCRSEAKVHPSFPRSASTYPILGLFLFPSKYFTTHQFTISPQNWGQILICGLATSKFNPRRSKKRLWPSWPITVFHPWYLLESVMSQCNNTSIRTALHYYMMTLNLQKVSVSLFSLLRLFFDGLSCSKSSCNLDRSSRWFFPRYTRHQDFVIPIIVLLSHTFCDCPENMWTQRRIHHL